MKRNGFVHEAEAYDLMEKVGLHPPRHGFAGNFLPFAEHEPVVLKGLGENLWHKSEIDAVRFLPFEIESIMAETERMRQRVMASQHRWIAGLVCERISIARNEHLPSEAFVSLSFGETGGTILFGFGGLAANALVELAPPLRWPLAFTTPADALREFEAHLLGRIWLGRVRGSRPLTTIETLARFFDSLWALAALAEHEGLGLLELNPVTLDQQGEPRPLDAVGSRRPRPQPHLGPPAGFFEALTSPTRIALAGVSAQEGGVGRTILENLRRYALPAGHLVLVKPGKETFLDLPCIPDVAALHASPVDLLILALPAPAAAETLTQLIAQGDGAKCAALVAGGLGDGADHERLGAKLSALLHEARSAGCWTPAVVGPNFLGHWVPGHNLDTSFIPTAKLTAPNPAGGELTLLSQSGAFLLSRRSRQPELRFRLGVALGNQLDVALCDLLAALAAESDHGPIAAYVEGFGPGQLLPAAQAIEKLKQQGRLVLIHRAGRTEAGQAAAASHTGAMASDLVLERELLTRAGAKFADTITAFDATLGWLSAWPELGSAVGGALGPEERAELDSDRGIKPLLHQTQPHGIGPVALLTNAGFESVNGSDVMSGGLPAAQLSESAQQSLSAILAKHELAGLVTPLLPLDLTPMANESVFLESADLLLGESSVLVIGLVPFTRKLDTTAAGGAALAAALVELSRKHSKPIAVVIDAGTDYSSYQQAFRDANLPVFDRMETALLGLRTLA